MMPVTGARTNKTPQQRLHLLDPSVSFAFYLQFKFLDKTCALVIPANQ